MISGGNFTRRDILRMAATAMAAAAVGRLPYARGQSTTPAPFVKRTRRPNILMMVADDHRHDVIRTMGDLTVQTPCFDRFAANGIAFSQAHHMGGNFPAVCVPTRGSLQTGCNVFRAMAIQTDNIISPDRVTLGQHFRNNGYRTHIVGKWHNDVTSLNRSFAGGEGIFLRGLATDQNRLRVHHYDPTGRYQNNTVYHPSQFSTDFFCDRTVEFLQTNKQNEPFFLYTGFTAPHDPRTPPKAYADMYNPYKIPLPANFAADHPFDNGELRIRDEETAPHPRAPQRVRKELADYYGMVSSLDAGIGRVLAALEATGQAENTIVVYTSDHGLALGQHGLMGKQNLYDHSTRVPLMMSGPGITAGQRSDALLYSWDLFPTLCDLTGVTQPSGLDARSLLPVIRGERDDHRTEVHALYRDFQRMTKNDRWKLIEYSVGQERHTQLFDLRDDKWEMHNLANESAASSTLTQLRTQLGQWQVAVGDNWKPARVAA